MGLKGKRQHTKGGRKSFARKKNPHKTPTTTCLPRQIITFGLEGKRNYLESSIYLCSAIEIAAARVLTHALGEGWPGVEEKEEEEEEKEGAEEEEEEEEEKDFSLHLRVLEGDSILRFDWNFDGVN